VCGDGFIVNDECEDLNFDSNDGCSSSCKVEFGYQCNDQIPSKCITVCGDGITTGFEECDEPSNLDSCTSDCKITYQASHLISKSNTGRIISTSI